MGDKGKGKGKGKATNGGRYRDLPDEEERIGDDPDEARRWEQEEQQVSQLSKSQARSDGQDVRQEAGRYSRRDLGDFIDTRFTSWANRARSW